MSVTFLLPAGRSRDRDRVSHGSDVLHDYVSQSQLGFSMTIFLSPNPTAFLCSDSKWQKKTTCMTLQTWFECMHSQMVCCVVEFAKVSLRFCCDDDEGVSVDRGHWTLIVNMTPEQHLQKFDETIAFKTMWCNVFCKGDDSKDVCNLEQHFVCTQFDWVCLELQEQIKEMFGLCVIPHNCALFGMESQNQDQQMGSWCAKFSCAKPRFNCQQLCGCSLTTEWIQTLAVWEKKECLARNDPHSTEWMTVMQKGVGLLSNKVKEILKRNNSRKHSSDSW